MKSLRLLNHSLMAACLCLVLFAACGKSQEQEAPPKQKEQTPPTAIVSNYPLQYMAKRIAGGAINITFPVPPNRDPGYWKPDDAAIALLQSADLIILNGATHENWMDKVTLDDNKVLDTSASFSDQLIVTDDAIVHSHGPEGKHSHEGTAFTLWLDPTLALLQARNITDAFTKISPENAANFAANFEALQVDFDDLNSILDAFTVNYKSEALLASHPVYQYLERRCNLNLKNLHWEPGETPASEEWEGLDELLAQHPAKWMLWEGEPTPETRAELEKRGVSILVFPPFGNVPEEGDFLSAMRGNFEKLLATCAPQIQ